LNLTWVKNFISFLSIVTVKFYLVPTGCLGTSNLVFPMKFLSV
jgi:hypothetical protein